MLLKNLISVSTRFQRSVNIELDEADLSFLEGYVPSSSANNLLLEMSACVADGSDAAFTWTGPYGSGKSSLALVLSGLLSGEEKVVKAATSTIGGEVAEKVLVNLAPKFGKRQLVKIVGSSNNPEKVVEQALLSVIPSLDGEFNNLFELLETLCNTGKDEHDGFILFIDEMGKLLEAAAHGKGDVFFFQQLAEFAARSKGRLLIVGVLHLAFNEYSGRLPQEAKREWLKVAGRFNDLSLNISGEEQLELISRAIEVESGKSRPDPKHCKAVASEIQSKRRGTSPSLAQTLEACWPLHPATAALIGPLSKRQFGQNQRSIFGFLNSAEISGFRDFLNKSNSINDVYSPWDFWDYLTNNLSSAIYNSPDGHRWSLITDAVHRCEASADKDSTVKLMKAIAILDFCKEQSGVFPTKNILQKLGIFSNQNNLESALSSLQNHSCIIFRNYQSSYAAFAGSDFDIEQALDEELPYVTPEAMVGSLDFPPFTAKNYYHKNGALKWFQVKAIEGLDFQEAFSKLEFHEDLSGVFLLCLDGDEWNANYIQNAISNLHTELEVCVGLARDAASLRQTTSELVALENIEKQDNRLKSDEVARKEVEQWLAFRRGEIDRQKHELFRNAIWYNSEGEIGALDERALNRLTSEICQKRYNDAPQIKNELLNRKKPSSSARAAQNEILKRLTVEHSEPDLGITGFPAERGLLESIVKASGLLVNGELSSTLVRPTEFQEDPLNLAPLWKATDIYLERRQETVVSIPELFNFWAGAPFGVARGLHPLLGILYFLTSKEKVAMYRDGVFQTSFSEADADLFGANQRSFGFRWMELDASSKELMSTIISSLRELQPTLELENPKAIDVARAIISFFDNLHATTSRTLTLPKNQLKLRDILKNANDPQDLLFRDLKGFFEEHCQNANVFSEQLSALANLFSNRMQAFKSLLEGELRLPNASSEAFDELNKRASNVTGISGNLRLQAFCKKLTSYRGTVDETEELVSLAAGKPTTMWFDQDFDDARIGLQEFARQFRVLEAHANVADRQNLSNVFAFIQKDDVNGDVKISEFSVLESEKTEINKIVSRLSSVIEEDGQLSRDVALAALYQLASKFNEDGDDDTKSNTA